MRRLNRLPFLAALLLAACDDGGPRVPEARVDSAAVQAGPHNVLSAVVRLKGVGDSARVIYALGPRIQPNSTDSTTPAFALDGDSVRIPVLGLRAGLSYDFWVMVYGGPDSALSPRLTLVTGSLPGDLPSYTAGGTSPLPGYVVFGAGNYGLVIDNTGRVVWYRRFPPNGPGLNFMSQPSGQYVARPGNNFLVVDALGDSVRSIACAGGRTLRFHDLLIRPQGDVWLMCDETRTVNLTAFGGPANAQVTGTVVQHLDAAGALLFEWNPFDHFAIDDVDPTVLTGANVNWTHGNSLDLDTDGHVLVSFRSLHEVTKFNSTTGAIIWRMGGRRNQFTFAGAGAPGFQSQHNVRVVGPNRFILLDNTGSADTRYERYEVNAAGLVATLEQSYGSPSGAQTAIGGSVQQAGTGRWLFSVGTTGHVEEFDGGGTLHWMINGNPGYVFRAQRIPSLYQPGVGAAR